MASEFFTDDELELIALRHQVTVLRRQRLGRLQLFITRPAPVDLGLPLLLSPVFELGARH
jgi:hypothetical protein